MKYLKFIVILMALLIFFSTSAIIYVVFDRLFSKQTMVFPEKDELRKLRISKNSEIVNANISDDKLILTIKLNKNEYPLKYCDNILKSVQFIKKFYK